ncbi:isochorismatase family cysteine hydrolase [Pseudovibrio sp. Tun.PSC04-5.I4]|uniref:cysteine hydrolase family protein n=1 Tax=Pseudovibrio sp. Tun.PSC04-5.I4 TaxID=1798213 RepID=UPI000B1F8F68|nr:isochorismatase family cysteine hydrolase [Pseudovibrio sp. Tun.PSC04-5.I4]
MAGRITVMNELAKDAKLKGQFIVAVKQVYEGAYTNFLIGLLGEGLCTKGSSGLELDKRLAFAPAITVIKHVGDTFTNSEFLQFLETHGIGTLRIAGLDGCYCVKSTVLSALGRGYGVELVEDGVLSISQESWKTCRTELEEKGAHLVQAPQLEGTL